MKMSPPQLSDFNSLLVVKTSSIGDVIHALPVISLLKRSQPSLSIGWVVRNRCSSVLEGNPDIDRLHVISDRSRTGDLADIRAELRRYDYQCALDMQGLFMSGMIAFLSGAPVRIGLDRNREGNKVFLTHPIVPGMVDRKVRDIHAIDVLLGFARVLGIDPLPELPVQQYLGFWDKGGLVNELDGIKAPRIALNVGASSVYKRWPMEHWIELMRMLVGHGYGVVFVGDTQDSQTVRRIVAEAGNSAGESASGPSHVVDFSGRTNLRELAVILARCSLVVSGDTGPMHLGSAVGTPIVALFGSTSPLRTGPYGNRHTVLDMHLACSPCFRRPTCEGRVDCMRGITPSEVFEAIHIREKSTTGPD